LEELMRFRGRENERCEAELKRWKAYAKVRLDFTSHEGFRKLTTA
jgi:hypothetical protein